MDNVVDLDKLDMNVQVSVVLPWMFDGDNGEDVPTFEAWLLKLVESYPVTAEVVNPFGPSGGWPDVKVTGLRRQVRGFLLAEYMAGEVASLNSIARLVEDYEGEL